MIMCSKSYSGLSPFRCHSSFVLVKFMLYLTLFHLINGFNLDTDSRIELNGPNAGSYFGYTVAMLNINDQNRWILLGAPKDNSHFLPDADRPGAIYICTFTLDFSNHSCEELFIDNKTEGDSAQFNGKNRIFTHGRDGQWLGASLDVNKDAGIVTCANRWYNKQFEVAQIYYMNGLCYEIPLDFNRNNIKKIPGLVGLDKQTMTDTRTNITKLNYGMGALGSSVHYSSKREHILLGAPGLWYFTGGLIDMHRSDALITENSKPPTERNEMAGYAITSGQYFGMGLTTFAIGAPRDHLTGKVFLYGYRDKFILEDPDLTLNGSEVIEIPVNGYFGASLCTVDVNNDGLDDLLVAAPFYSKGEREETGVVIVYLGQDRVGQGSMTFQPMTYTLTGSDSSGARFGTAMASLGDISKDKYNDIVIGAPYEDDLRGAIYIYNGCKTGVWPHFSQRIEADSFRDELRSFGFSFSKAVDMDNDGVNDIAVGAYLSDKAYILFGQSVINIEITLVPSVSQIDKDTTQLCPSTSGTDVVPCFRANVCFYYIYRQFNTIELNVTLELDTYMWEYNRIAFQSNGGNVDSFIKKIFSGVTSCIGDKHILIKSTSDLVTPVRMKASYDVLNIPGSARVQPTINKFDGHIPDKQILIATKIIYFKKDCPNIECKTDLRLKAKADYGKSEDYFIFGASTLTIDVSILKEGDPSYSSNFFIAFPNTLQYQKVTKVYGDSEINCGFVNFGTDDSDEEDIESLEHLQRRNIPKITENELLLACSFGNPLYANNGVRFQLSMSVPDPINNTKLEFKLNATTLSTELVPADNVKTINVQVRNQVATTITGISKLTIKDKERKYLISHTYELRNKGPSSLPTSTLLILYPQIQQGGSPLLYLNTANWSCPTPCRVFCSSPDATNTTPVVHAASMGPTYLETLEENDKNIRESKTVADMKNIDCAEGDCSRYECNLYDIPPRESAVVTLEYVASGDILDKVSDGGAIKIRSKAYVRLLDLSRLITDASEQSESVYSDLLPVSVSSTPKWSPPPQRLPWWIILLSVLGGLLIDVLIVIILWKTGFFKRKQMEELRRMQQYCVGGRKTGSLKGKQMEEMRRMQHDCVGGKKTMLGDKRVQMEEMRRMQHDCVGGRKKC